MGNMFGKQLRGDECLGHASPCYWIEKTCCVAKQHRAACNSRAGTATQGRRAKHRGYLLRAVQS